MVEDLSMHVADLLENSLRAGARNIELLFERRRNELRLEVTDDGAGMDGETLRRAADPFFTTKDGRRIGLGVPLLVQTAEELGGEVEISSRPGGGTRVAARIPWDHPDRPPLGDLAGTILPIILTSPDVRFRVTITSDRGTWHMDTDEIKRELGEVPMDHPEVMAYLEEEMRRALREHGFKEAE